MNGLSGPLHNAQVFGIAACACLGTVLSARPWWIDRVLGAGCLALAVGLSVQPAFADQLIEAIDNAGVDCTIASHELTRISLVGDQFASVSKTEASDPRDDFSVVNEPTRGDIYISLPEGFRPRSLSFFGTSRKGFVYKFACRVEKIAAQQIFVSNSAAAEQALAPVTGPDTEEAPDPDEVSVRLIQGMAAQKAVAGFRMTRATLAPVRTGNLMVQLIAEYRGLDLVGRVIRITNTSGAPVTLSETVIAPASAVAVSLSSTTLAPGQVTGAYVVTAGGR